MYKIYLLLSVSVAFSSLLLSCGSIKKDSDPSDFKKVCVKVVQCDHNFNLLPEPQVNCEKLMTNINEKFPDKIYKVRKCIMKTSCDKLDFKECMSYINE